MRMSRMSLRKRLSKRTTPEPTEEEGSSIANNTLLSKRLSRYTTPEPTEEEGSSIANKPSVLAAEAHLRKPTTTTEETMDLTQPPPPPPSMLPREPEKLLSSPSKSLLHRYRSPASAEMPKHTSRSFRRVAKPSPAPSNVTMSSRSKVPSFTEDFEHSKSAAELTAPPRVASSTSISSATHTVGGVEFEMLNSLQPSTGHPTRSKSAEPARSRSVDKDAEDGETPHFRRKRQTRSETRETRADSTNGDLDVNIAKLQKDTAEPTRPEAEKPRLKSILKKKEKANPLIATKPKIPRVTRSTTAADSAKNKYPNTTPDEDTIRLINNSSSSSDSSSDSSDDCDFILDNKTGTAPTSSQQPHHPIPPTRVIPTAPVGYILPGLVWCSPLSGTSRPSYPWLWSKRWTCCRCSATTIVEQPVCARLTCGHHRCGKQCKLERETRVMMPRVQV